MRASADAEGSKRPFHFLLRSRFARTPLVPTVLASQLFQCLINREATGLLPRRELLKRSQVLAYNRLSRDQDEQMLDEPLVVVTGLCSARSNGSERRLNIFGARSGTNGCIAIEKAAERFEIPPERRNRIAVQKMGKDKD